MRQRRFRRVMLLVRAGARVFSSVLAVVCTAVSAAAGVEVSLSPNPVDFGKARERGAFATTRVVEVVNPTKQAIEVRQVDTGCGCVTAPSFDRSVAAGSRGKIILHLDPAKVARGSHNYGFKVELTGAQPARLLGSFTYEYQPDFEVAPEELNIRFDTARLAASAAFASGTVRIFDSMPGGKLLKVISVESSNPLMEQTIRDVETTNTDGTKSHYIDLAVILTPGWPIGPINERVTIQTTHQEHPTLTIPVRGEVVGPVKAFPPSVVLRGLGRGQGFKRAVRLKAESPIVLGKITSSSPTMKWTSEAAGAEVILQITDRIPNTSDGAETASLVKTDMGDLHGTYWERLDIEVLKPRHYVLPVRVRGAVEPPPATSVR